MHHAYATTTAKFLQKQLYKAEGFLYAKPTLSHDILKQDLHSINKLATVEQLRWLQTLLRASVALNRLDDIESTAKQMLAIPSLKQDTPKLVTLLSSLGIMFRRQGYLADSIDLFDCALELPIKDHNQIISLKLSKGISLRNQGITDKTIVLYQSALKGALSANSLKFEGAIRNALGVLALNENDLINAKKELRKALTISQNTARRSGQTIAGLNLMLIAVLEEDELMYSRLHGPISTLTLAAKNQDRHVYLYWLEHAYSVQRGEQLTDKIKEKLIEKLSSIKEMTLHNLLLTNLAKPLGIEAFLRERQRKKYQGDIFQHLTFCD